MISVTPHINKLDALRKYMDVWVEGWHAKNIFDKIELGISKMSVDEMIRLYNQTGALFYEKKDIPIESPKELLPFEAWYNLYLTTNN